MTAVPALMGRLDSSMERVPEVGETNVAIMRDVNGTCSHWETGRYLYPRTQSKTGCGILVFVFGSYSRSVIRAKAHAHLLDAPTLLEVHKQRGNTCGNE